MGPGIESNNTLWSAIGASWRLLKPGAFGSWVKISAQAWYWNKMTYFHNDWVGVDLTHSNGEVELKGDRSRHLLHSKVGCTRDLVPSVNNIPVWWLKLSVIGGIWYDQLSNKYLWESIEPLNWRLKSASPFHEGARASNEMGAASTTICVKKETAGMRDLMINIWRTERGVEDQLDNPIFLEMSLYTWTHWRDLDLILFQMLFVELRHGNSNLGSYMVTSCTSPSAPGLPVTLENPSPRGDSHIYAIRLPRTTWMNFIFDFVIVCMGGNSGLLFVWFVPCNGTLGKLY